jgi:hypothetical protein
MIKLTDGKYIQGNYSSMFYAFNAADNYEKLAKQCGLTAIEYVDIRPLTK